VIQLHEFIIFVGFVVFGHHDLQTLFHLISLCWDFLKKESTAITQEACKTLNLTLKSLLLALTKTFLKICKKHSGKGERLCSRGGGHFSISCNFTVRHAFDLRKDKSKMN
jgi:hypothetical protein